MGPNSILNQEQVAILEAFRQSPELTSTFYFSGGTALSEYYLKHRESVDLDFFSEKKFDQQIIVQALDSWSKKHQFTLKTQFTDPTHIFFLKFANGRQLKLDFAYYPYSALEKRVSINGILVDSLFDIATNKFLTINQRTEVKDFVDIYFLSEKFSFWTLRDGVKAKFNIEIEPYLMATDYTKVKSFEVMPKMFTPLSLETLQEFFLTQAKKLGSESTGI
jgi:predicted nucleotidyltransferase component of viral defense system